MVRLFMGFTVVALMFFGLLYGAAMMRFEFFPHAWFDDAFKAAEALLSQKRQAEPVSDLHVGAKPIAREDYSNPAVRESKQGVFDYDPSQAYNGYTVYAPMKLDYPIPLVDMDGNVLHEWSIPESAVRGGEREDGLTMPDNPISVTFAHLYPNGDMLMVLNITWMTPWGYGIVKVDKDSNLIWKYMKQAHHNAAVAPDGKIYGQLHYVVHEPWPGLEHITTPFVDDTVVVLTPDGKEIKEVSVMKAIQNSDFESLLMYAERDNPRGDILHVNKVEYITAEMAEVLPFADEGQLLISIRNLDVLAVMDIDEETITWAVRGYWRMQHDPDVLENGNVLIYDNRGDLGRGGRTRIVEIDPKNLALEWVWPEEGDKENLLYSSVYGSQQRLPNGNTLVSESNNGLIVEVTEAGEKVWSYYVPERRITKQGEEKAQALWATRVLPDQLEFEFSRPEKSVAEQMAEQGL